MKQPGWHQVTRDKPCAVCARPNHDHPSCWCFASDDGCVAVCRFVADGAIKTMPGGGYLHRIADIPKDRPRREIARPTKPKPPPPDWNALIETYRAAMDYNRLDALADALGVCSETLDVLDIGFMGGTKWSFPMFKPTRDPIGIRTRSENGEKRSVTGTTEGLFIPRCRRDGPLFFVEGPTDCAAMMDIGFDCIGRPAAFGCEDWCAVLGYGRECVIVADNDAPDRNGRKAGDAGADRLAAVLTKNARCVRVIHAPYLKDVREWKRNGATRDSILRIVAATRPWRRAPLLKGKP